MSSDLTSYFDVNLRLVVRLSSDDWSKFANTKHRARNEKKTNQILPNVLRNRTSLYVLAPARGSQTESSSTVSAKKKKNATSIKRMNEYIMVSDDLYQSCSCTFLHCIVFPPFEMK